MHERLSLLMIVALGACGGPAGVTALDSASPSDEVVSMSRAAVQDPPPMRAASIGPAVPFEEAARLEAVARSEAEPAEAIELARFALRRGETLDHFAKWSGFPVESVAEYSGLPLDGAYDVGAEVLLPVHGEALAEVVSRRDAHWTRRIDGYLASRGGSIGTEFYRVRTGDSAWAIATQQHGFPVWLLEAFNPSVDLDRLRPGQDLMVPILADVLVDAGHEPPSGE